MDLIDTQQIAKRTAEVLGVFSGFYISSFIEATLNTRLEKSMANAQKSAKAALADPKIDAAVAAVEKPKEEPLEFLDVLGITGSSKSVDVDLSEYTNFQLVGAQVARKGSRIRVTEKRYRDMNNFYDDLRKEFKENKEIKFPEFPPKKFFGNMDPSFVKTRQAELDVWVKTTLAIPEVRESGIFRKYFGFQADPQRVADMKMFNNALTKTCKKFGFLPPNPKEIKDESTGLVVLMISVARSEFLNNSFDARLSAQFKGVGVVVSRAKKAVEKSVYGIIGQAVRSSWDLCRSNVDTLKKKLQQAIDSKADMVDDVLTKLLEKIGELLKKVLGDDAEEKKEDDDDSAQPSKDKPAAAAASAKKDEEKDSIQTADSVALPKLNILADGKRLLAALANEAKATPTLQKVQKDFSAELKAKDKLKKSFNQQMAYFHQKEIKKAIESVILVIETLFNHYHSSMDVLIAGSIPFFQLRDDLEAKVSASANVVELLSSEISNIETALNAAISKIALDIGVKMEGQLKTFRKGVSAIPATASEDLLKLVDSIPAQTLNFFARFRDEWIKNLKAIANHGNAVEQTRQAFINGGAPVFDDWFGAMYEEVSDALEMCLHILLLEELKDKVGPALSDGLKALSHIIPSELEDCIKLENSADMIVDKLLEKAVTKLLGAARAKIEVAFWAEQNAALEEEAKTAQ